jgi:dihydroneopterin aldolase
MIQPPYTRIFLDNVVVPVHVGVWDWEKSPERQWPLTVSVELYTRRTEWDGAVVTDVVDYSKVYDYLQTWRSRPHVELLETLAEDLLRACFADSQVCACRVSLTKTQLYPDAHAGVEIFRVRG